MDKNHIGTSGPDNSHPLFDQASLQILGLARQFDFVIRLFQQDAYARLRAGEREILSVYAHEWTHYFHFLGTWLGNFAAETELNCFHLKMNLLVQTSVATGGNFEPPVLELLKRAPALVARPKVREAADALAIHCQVRKKLYSTWAIHETPQHLTLEEIRRRRPFALDQGRRALTYTSSNGSVAELRISVKQILEHAAQCSQAMVAGGIFTRNLLRKELLDYHGLILYMYQERMLNILTNDELFMIVLPGKEGAEAVLMTLTTIFLACQVALMLNLLPQFHRSYDETALGDPVSKEKVEFADGCMASAAHVLCVLLSRFQELADHLIQMIAISDKPSLRPLDAFCASVKLPSYSEALQHQATRAAGAAREAPEHTPFLFDPTTHLKTMMDVVDDHTALLQRMPTLVDLMDRMPAFYTDLFFRRASITSEALLRDATLSFNPVFNCDGVPLPYVLVETAQGTRRLGVKFPWQSHPTVVEIPVPVTSYYLEESMIVDKLLFDSELACYRAGADREATRVTKVSSGCEDFDACFRRTKDTLIDFCSQDDWRRKAQVSLDLLRLFGRGRS